MVTVTASSGSSGSIFGPLHQAEVARVEILLVTEVQSLLEGVYAVEIEVVYAASARPPSYWLTSANVGLVTVSLRPQRRRYAADEVGLAPHPWGRGTARRCGRATPRATASATCRQVGGDSISIFFHESYSLGFNTM